MRAVFINDADSRSPVYGAVAIGFQSTINCLRFLGWLNRSEARHMAANLAKLPGHLRKG
jgi:hypothetical protein